MIGCLQFVDIALWRFLVDPAQEFRNDRAVALLRGLLPRDLGIILDRLGQDGRVTQRQDFCSRLFQRFEDGRDRALWIDDDRLALELGQSPFELKPLMQPDAVAEMLAQLRRYL